MKRKIFGTITLGSFALAALGAAWPAQTQDMETCRG